jgi:hypothetical protein
LRGLADDSSSPSPLTQAIVGSIFPWENASYAASDFSSAYLIPGSNAGDVLYNAAYGNLSPNQVAQQTAQEQAQLVQAGMAPAAASTQATSDVDDALSTYSGPGGAGVTWTGALPSQPGFPTAAANAAGNAIFNAVAPTAAAIPTWAWYAAGAVGALLLFGFAKKAL